MHIKSAHLGFAQGWFDTTRKAGMNDQAAYAGYQCLQKVANPLAALGHGADALMSGLGGGMENMGSGMENMGIASLARVDPRLAALAAAKLEADTEVNSMSPLEGTGLGAGAGGLLGLLAGGATGGLGGAAMGGLGGALMGGGLSQQYEASQRRAQAFKDALKRYKMSGV